MTTKKMLKQIQAAHTLADLEKLQLGTLTYLIGGRGGYVGWYGGILADVLNIPPSYLSRKFGCYCNYLGGGIRGKITPSGYADAVKGNARVILDALSAACIRAYMDAESDNGLDAEQYEDGSVNWENAGTQAARRANIISAY